MFLPSRNNASSQAEPCRRAVDELLTAAAADTLPTAHVDICQVTQLLLGDLDGWHVQGQMCCEVKPAKMTASVMQTAAACRGGAIVVWHA
jgi:ketopantoate hydroxymethyltransferase